MDDHGQIYCQAVLADGKVSGSVLTYDPDSDAVHPYSWDLPEFEASDFLDFQVEAIIVSLIGGVVKPSELVQRIRQAGFPSSSIRRTPDGMRVIKGAKSYKVTDLLTYLARSNG